MKQPLQLLKQLPQRLGRRGTAAAAALAAVSVGCAMERLSLGLIVPGAFVLAALVWSHVRGVG